MKATGFKLSAFIRTATLAPLLRAAVASGVVLVMAACGSKAETTTAVAAESPKAADSNALTREEAKRQISTYPKFATVSHVVGIPTWAFKNAVNDGVRDLRGIDWVPTAKGAEYFSEGGLPGEVTLRTPLRRTVSEITGITDDQERGGKLVEFRWHFEEVPDAIARYTGVASGDHQGTAHFRRYDDGWRVIDVDTKANQDASRDQRPAPNAAHALRRTMADLCAMALSWDGRATDLGGTYYLMPYTEENSPTSRYRADGAKSYAEFLNAITPTYMRSVPRTDGFGNPYEFKVTGGGQHFTVTSFGADRRPGTADDLAIEDGARWVKDPSGSAPACR